MKITQDELEYKMKELSITRCSWCGKQIEGIDVYGDNNLPLCQKDYLDGRGEDLEKITSIILNEKHFESYFHKHIKKLQFLSNVRDSDQIDRVLKQLENTKSRYESDIDDAKWKLSEAKSNLGQTEDIIEAFRSLKEISK